VVGGQEVVDAAEDLAAWGLAGVDTGGDQDSFIPQRASIVPRNHNFLKREARKGSAKFGTLVVDVCEIVFDYGFLFEAVL